MVPPQWQAILQVTIGEVLLTRADTSQAETAFRSAIVIAGAHRLPNQIQRAVRASGRRLPAVAKLAHQALSKLRVPGPIAAGDSNGRHAVAVTACRWSCLWACPGRRPAGADGPAPTSRIRASVHWPEQSYICPPAASATITTAVSAQWDTSRPPAQVRRSPSAYTRERGRRLGRL